jgi:hypothetical protein
MFVCVYVYVFMYMFCVCGNSEQRYDLHPEQNSTIFHHAYQNNTQFKTYELFIFGIFHLIFLTLIDDV